MGRPAFNRPALGIIRVRVDRATICHYADSDRIVLVADKGDFDAAQEALDKLRKALAR